MNRKLLLLFTIFIVSSSIPSTMYAWTTWGTPNYQPTMALGANPNGSSILPNDFVPLKSGAKDTWNAAPCPFVFTFYGWTYAGVPVNDDINQTMYGDYPDPGVLAVTYLVTNGPYRECDELFDENYPWYMGTGSCPYNNLDAWSTWAHELGHVLGLGHSTDPSATMYGIVNWGDISKRTLEADDIAGLQYLYGSGDGLQSSGFDQLSPAGVNLRVKPYGANYQVSLELNAAAQVNVKVFDASGRIVESLVNANLNEGEYNYNWNTSNVSAGVYFVSLETPQANSSAKVVVVK